MHGELYLFSLFFHAANKKNRYSHFIWSVATVVYNGHELALFRTTYICPVIVVNLKREPIYLFNV